MSRLEGKIALITGASSGIGAATALHFASLGCSVALNGRNVERLQEKASKCQEAGLRPEQVLIVAGDITDEDAAEKVLSRTVEHFGRLDILVNNAGVGEYGKLEGATLSQLDRLFQINFRAAFHLTQLASSYLKLSKGNVVNVSSVASQVASDHHVVYGAAKAALDHLTKSVARDLGPYGVRVNAVNPGFVDTEVWNHARMEISEEQLKAVLERGKSLHVLERIASPVEVAKPIAFLASDDASFITGVTLLVDGGLKLKGSVW